MNVSRQPDDPSGRSNHLDDPRATIAQSPMSWAQIIVIAITVGLNALDGFDVLAISFASPGIAKEWGIDRTALGFVLSMELFGMGFGSILLGGVADRIGRRRTLLGCLVVMAGGMSMATQAHNVPILSFWRVITGLGIGGMLASINAVAAEFSNLRRRGLNVSIMAIGYPVGAVVGGSIAAALLEHHDWRAIFAFGAAATASFIPLVFFLVPESVAWLCQRQPRGALASMNRALLRMGHAAVERMPLVHAASTVAARDPLSVVDIFGPSMVRSTVLMASSYFLHVISFYFIVKWTPKIVVDMGFTQSAAAGVLVWTNVGGALGGATLGLLSLKFGVKPLTMAVLVLSTIMLAVFGHGYTELSRLTVVCALCGFFTNAGIVGLYGIFAQAYPTYLRATGTGFAVGFGRAGSVLAPIVAGFLFTEGYALQGVAIAMGVGSLIAAIALGFLQFRAGEA